MSTFHTEESIQYITSAPEDAEGLAEIRAVSMKPSLEALGRYDDERVRSRFLETFNPDDTIKVMSEGKILGFYVVREREDHLYLDHLYIVPEYQSKSIGRAVIEKLVAQAQTKGIPVRLGALRGSKSNDFYLQNGFVKTHEDEFDIYYERAATE